MITTLEIFSIGSPADDPLLPLHATLYIPDPQIHPGPYHCFAGTRAGGFTDGGLRQLENPFTDLSNAGFLCLAFECRLVGPPFGPGLDHKQDHPPIPQTTTGQWHQQTDDCIIALRYMRQDGKINTFHGYEVTGFVGMLGGSGSGHHAIYRTIDGTQGDDKADAAIGMSPVTDFSDRDPLVYSGVGMGVPFISKCAQYGDNGNELNLTKLRSESPIGHPNLADANPILHFNGDNENMPLSELNRFAAAIAAAGASGYSSFVNTGDLGMSHAFAMWNGSRSGTGGIGPQAVQWAKDRAAEFNGDTPPPPDPTPSSVLLPYTAWLTTTTLGATGKIPLILGNKTQSSIINLTEGASYTAHLIANNRFGSSTEASADFITLGIPGGGGHPPPAELKPRPAGIYTIFTQPDGAKPENLDTLPWWDNPEVVGGRYRATWHRVQPTSGAPLFSDIDTFIALCEARGKMASLSVSFGNNTPQFVIDAGAVTVNLTLEPDPGIMPLPWDAIYLKYIKKFIQQLSKYESSKSLSYVVISGLGKLVEVLLAEEAADVTLVHNAAIAAGYDNAIEGWLFAASQIMQSFSKAFPTTHKVISLHNPLPNSYTPPGTTAQQSLVDQFFGGPPGTRNPSIGLMNAGLNAMSDTSFKSNDLIFKNSEAHSAGFQFASRADDITDFTDTLQAGLELGAHYIEIYQPDGEDPTFAAVRTNYNNLLKATV